MRRILQVSGLLLILIGVRALFSGDWLIFVMSASLGVSFLIDPGRSKAARRLRELLILLTLVLAVVRLAVMFIG